MFSMKALFVRALVALSLAVAAAPAALAGPLYYQVSIDSSDYDEARFLDLQLGALGAAELTFAYITNLSGDFGAVTLDNASGDIATGFTIRNDAGLNSVLLELVKGGMISFNVSFSSADAGDGTAFTAALLDADFDYVAGSGPLVAIGLLPGAVDEVITVPGVGGVNAVPEPSDWLLIASGLALMAFTRRLQARR